MMLRLWGAIADGRTVARPHSESPEVLIPLESFM